MRMRSTTMIVAAVAVVGLALAPAAAAHGDSHHLVKVRDYEYDPAFLNVHVGDTVEWFNEGQSPHTVASHYHGAAPASEETSVNADDPTADADGFHATLSPTDDPFTPEDDRTFEHTFENPGVYVINCNLGNEHEAMKQVILVN